MLPSLRYACLALAFFAAAAAFSACACTGIAIKEQLGYAKREQLVDKVQSTRDSQVEAKQQFESALAEFIAVTGVKVSELESQYDKLRKSHARCESKAAAVSSRISDTDRVAAALFKEWERELDQYASTTLRDASAKQLKQTRERYAQLIGAMKAAEEKMQPVLAAFKDQVLFLKHNLNAQAISALQGTVTQIQDDVASLIREMEASISQANTFIQQMQRPTE